MSLCLDKICRTCMEYSSGRLLPLHAKNDKLKGVNSGMLISSPSIIEMFASLGIELLNGNKLPENICISCVSEINRAFSFKQKCQRSEITLKSYIGHIIEKDEPKDDEKCSLKEEKLFQQPVVKVTGFPDLGEIAEQLLNDDVLPTATQQQDNQSIQAEDTDENLPTSDSGDHNDEKNNTDDDKITANEEDSCFFLFQCGVCGAEFHEKDDHKMHMIDDHLTMFCELCSIFFEPSAYFHHCKNEHELIDIIETSEEFDEEIQENEITKSTETNYHYKYDGDDQKIEVNSLKADHLQISNSDNDLGDNSQELQKYLNTNENVQINLLSLACKKCGGRFAKEKSLQLHQNSNKCTQLPYPCETCKKFFASKKSLLRHQKNAHDEVIQRFKCTQCDREYSKKERLVLHIRAHHNGNDGKNLKKHDCPHCEKSFNMKSTLNDHIRVHNGERPYLCPICGKGFTQNTNLRQHLMRHNQTKPFKCSECSRAFVSKGELDAHLRKHTGDHPFVCITCGTGFTTSSSLIKHKRIHTGERPYACEYCPMRFTALGTLKNHRRTHTGERPFACKFCDRSFTQQSDMVSHTRTHTGERPYICTACGSKFPNSSSLKSHMKKRCKNNESLQESKTIIEVQ